MSHTQKVYYLEHKYGYSEKAYVSVWCPHMHVCMSFVSRPAVCHDGGEGGAVFGVASLLSAGLPEPRGAETSG